MKEILKKENRTTLIVAAVCLAIVGIIATYTYSFFAVEVKNSSIIAGEAESMSLGLTVTPLAGKNNKLIPQLDEYITSAIVGRQGSCIDDNGNTVCHTYQVTLRNTGASSVTVTGNLTLDNKNNPNLKWAVYNYVEDFETGNDVPSLVGNIKTPAETTITSNETITASTTKTYYIVVWISETGLSQTDKGTYSGVVTFSNTDTQTTPNSALATLTSLGLTNKINDTELKSFTATSKEDGTIGIYKTQDDIGDSYYFRGNVDYNYVKFGKYTTDVYAVINYETLYSTYSTTCPNEEDCIQIASAGDDMYWRIIRINGDGTIRMIYTGTEPYANNATDAIRHIGKTAYNYDCGVDNACVGYMYGTVGSSAYPDTHENNNNRNIKTMVDLWFDTYLETNYGSYITDAIYCNDRSLSTNDSSYTGIGITTTNYAPYERLYENDTVTPTLKCSQENDRFTVEPTVSGVTGNNKLSNPVGLITVDEMTFAGSFFTNENDQMFLYDYNYYFWTSSPSFFAGSYTYIFYSDVGGVGGEMYSFYFDGVARPVISLKSGVIIDGTGYSYDPFVIEVSDDASEEY